MQKKHFLTSEYDKNAVNSKGKHFHDKWKNIDWPFFSQQSSDSD